MRSNGKIPRWGLGCWQFGGEPWTGQDDRDSRQVLERAVEAGITHLDTAQGYGHGHSERIVGEFAGRCSQSLFVATKSATRADKADMLESVEMSLRNLGLDVIDLFYIHWPADNLDDHRPQMEALEEARERGKIRYIGVSNFSVDQMSQVLEVGTIDAHQLCYNLYWRFCEAEVLPFCKDRGIEVVTYSSIAQGILTGKFPREPQVDDGDVRPGTVLFEDDVWPAVYEGTERLKELAEPTGRALMDLAVQWVAAREAVDSVLVGARTPRQLEGYLQATRADFDDDILARAGEIGRDVFQAVPDDAPNLFRHAPRVSPLRRRKRR